MTEKAELTVTRLGIHGDGFAYLDEAPVLVPFALPGEKVMAGISREKGVINARLLEILTPSPQRQTPPCPHFGAHSDILSCGGCRLQHASDELYREWKREKVKHLLARAGFEQNCDALFITPPASRRRAVFAAKKSHGRLVLGFNARGKREITDIQSCLVLHPALSGLLGPLRILLAEILKDGDGLDIHMTLVDDQREVVFIGLPLSAGQEKKITAWALAQNITSAYANDRKGGMRLLLQQAPLTIRYGQYKVGLPPASFLQASAEAEQAMVEFIAPHMKDATSFADLFCGTGLFTLSFADGPAKILGIDSDARALETLTLAARGLPHIKIRKRNLFTEPLLAADLNGLDAVILDPPRAGAHLQAKELAASDVKKIIYVSCNPQSFARDAWELKESGYRLVDLKLFDQFLWSEHVELVGVFEK